MVVSCPDWSRLAAARNAQESPEGYFEGQQSAAWTEALEHFDSCSRCRGEALKADPLLVFRRLPAPDMSAGEERLEVESMQQAVAAMRTARRLESRGEARGRFAGWRRWAAAAVLAVVSLGVGRDREPSLDRMAAPPPAHTRAVPASSGAAAPLLDGLDRPGARVYQWDSDDLSTVMIVDESFAENLDV